MLELRRASILCLASLLSFFAIQTEAAGINPIEIKGAKLFDSVTKEQFFIKGLVIEAA
jgi:hypothetical protein